MEESGEIDAIYALQTVDREIERVVEQANIRISSSIQCSGILVALASVIMVALFGLGVQEDVLLLVESLELVAVLVGFFVVLLTFFIPFSVRPSDVISAYESRRYTETVETAMNNKLELMASTTAYLPVITWLLVVQMALTTIGCAVLATSPIWARWTRLLLYPQGTSEESPVRCRCAAPGIAPPPR